MISNDPKDIEAMKRAVMNPELVLVSDWTKYKSWEYMEAEEAAAFTIL